MLLRGARLARRLCSRAGPAEAALSRAPPLLREYLKIAPENRKVCSFERAGREGMEKVLGIGAEVFELLPYDKSRGNHRQDCRQNKDCFGVHRSPRVALVDASAKANAAKR